MIKSVHSTTDFFFFFFQTETCKRSGCVPSRQLQHNQELLTLVLEATAADCALLNTEEKRYSGKAKSISP